jgi:hypothetical protein
MRRKASAAPADEYGGRGGGCRRMRTTKVASEQTAVDTETARTRARMAPGSSRDREGDARVAGEACNGST